MLPLLSKLLNSPIDSILMPNTVKEGDIINFGKYEWRVLQVNDNSALVISETTIGKAPYHDCNMTGITWKSCNLRKYLNGEFYDKFTEAEKSRIIKTKLSDCNNPWYDVKCGNSTFDRIFLLSYDEVVRYLGDSGDLKNKNGFYCDKDGNFTRVAESSMYTQKPHGDTIFDQYNDAWKVLNFKCDEDWWWLHYFNNVAYEKGDEWQDCYCMHFHYDSVLGDKSAKGMSAAHVKFNRVFKTHPEKIAEFAKKKIRCILQ